MQIYILFINIIIGLLLIIACIFIMAVMDKGLITDYLRAVLPFGLFVILLLCGINTAFFMNRKLLLLLGKEDWPALADYLEQKIYRDGKFSYRNVKLLIQSYLVLGKFNEIINLKDKVAAVKPGLADRFALAFGSAYLLNQDPSVAAAYFQSEMDKGRPAANEWLRWFYGFSLVLSETSELAGDVFMKLAAEADDIIVTGLSAFLLAGQLGNRSAARAEWYTGAEEGKKKVLKSIKSVHEWTAKAQKTYSEVHGAIIKKYIDEAGAWIFEGAGNEKH